MEPRLDQHFGRERADEKGRGSGIPYPGGNELKSQAEESGQRGAPM